MLDYESTFSGFSTNDIDEARAFYEGTLGFDVETTPEGALTVHLADGANVFIYEKPDHEPATFTVLNFMVGDIDVAVEQLSEQGIEMVQYDNPSLEQDESGVMRGLSMEMGPDIAWFEDPAGNILSVLQGE